jgi:hypothetical protein
MYCSACGQILPDDANYCAKCGASQRPNASDRGSLELCEVQYHIDKFSMFGSGQVCRLEAIAIGRNGTYSVGKRIFKLSTPCYPEENKRFRADLEELMKEVLSQGWRPIGSQTVPIGECAGGKFVSLPRFERPDGG